VEIWDAVVCIFSWRIAISLLSAGQFTQSLFSLADANGPRGWSRRIP